MFCLFSSIYIAPKYKNSPNEERVFLLTLSDYSVSIIEQNKLYKLLIDISLRISVACLINNPTICIIFTLMFIELKLYIILIRKQMK